MIIAARRLFKARRNDWTNGRIRELKQEKSAMLL
jgi:hypothetical protein